MTARRDVFAVFSGLAAGTAGWAALTLEDEASIVVPLLGAACVLGLVAQWRHDASERRRAAFLRKADYEHP